MLTKHVTTVILSIEKELENSGALHCSTLEKEQSETSSFFFRLKPTPPVRSGFPADDWLFCNPSLFSFASHWTTALFIPLPHWRSLVSNELILVKYSRVFEVLKIDRYIKLAVQPRWAPILPADGQSQDLRRRREKKEAFRRSLRPLPCSVPDKRCSRGSLVPHSKPDQRLQGGAGSDELPSFPFSCGFERSHFPWQSL